MFFCETKYGSESLPNIDGYYHFRQDRDKGSGGGVCIYVALDITASPVDSEALNKRDIEQTWCVIHQGADKVLVGCIYRPPNTSLDNHLHTTSRVVETLKHAKQAVKMLGCSAMFVYGDFNLPHSRYEPIDVGGGAATLGYVAEDTTGCKSSDEMFLNALQDLELQQLVTFPTYHDSHDATPTNTLDLVITDNPDRATAVEPDAPLGSTPRGRAHVVVKWCIVTARTVHQKKSRPRFLWSKATLDQWRALKQALAMLVGD